MNFFVPNADNFYSAVEFTRHNMSPMRLGLMQLQKALDNSHNPLINNKITGVLNANLEIIERITRTYKKPEFGIKEINIGEKTYKVKQEIHSKDTFCHLQHFSKVGFEKQQPKLLMVAPMAGHHATLLKHTLQDALEHFDVYITDWVDANQIPIGDGSFDLDDFIDYMINYMKLLGPDVHVMAVCQPTVPVLAATALMSEDNDIHIPKSVILIGGPIDARKKPTLPNEFAIDKTLEWFDQSVISTVPNNYPGFRRRVYPGFIQLSGFLAMNLKNHVDSHVDLYKNLISEDIDKIEKQRSFYNEYLSVMDLPAEFYLQTIKEVFHDFSLAKGKFVSRGRKVELGAIKKSAIMGIEGELDDIASVGQTKAALSLCKNVPESKKTYFLQKGVGHYGSFTGSKFRKYILPEIKKFVYSND